MEHDLRLDGPVVRLAPLEDRHAHELAALGDPDALRWHTSTPPLDAATAATQIAALRTDPSVQAFAVLGAVAGELRGITSFYEHAPSVPRVEIGHTFYGRRFWGGETNPHTKLLMLTHAFETWGCERVALRCDSENLRSAGAIERLGARAEGVLRSHRRRHDGTVADTAYYSIVRTEWPRVKARLLDRTGGA